MTYLDLVNNVMKRLRERTVATWNQTTYSAMVGSFINDAKYEIERSWDWSALRTKYTLATVASTEYITLTGAGEDPKVLSFWNDTLNVKMIKRSQEYFDKNEFTSTVPEGGPNEWTFDGVDASNDSIIRVNPIPDGVYSLPMRAVVYSQDFDDDADDLAIPARPIYLLAVAMLAEEKGETGGTTSARYFEMADKAYADAVALDASKHPTETIWQGV